MKLAISLGNSLTKTLFLALFSLMVLTFASEETGQNTDVYHPKMAALPSFNKTVTFKTRIKALF